jgi:hypothetical protein
MRPRRVLDALSALQALQVLDRERKDDMTIDLAGLECERIQQAKDAGAFRQAKAAAPEVTFKLDVEPEDIPVRGMFESGDAEADKRLEDEIISRADRGDVWAWAYVKVTASVTLDGQTFTGSNGCGACSYKDEADFMANNGGLYEQTKVDALSDLADNIQREITRGKTAEKLDALLQKAGVYIG